MSKETLEGGRDLTSEKYDLPMLVPPGMEARQSPGVGEPCLDIFPQSHGTTYPDPFTEVVAHARPFIHTQTPTSTATL